MAIRGSLGEATFADVLQLLALGRKSGCLSVFEGQKFGRVYLHAGRIIHAGIVNRRDRLGDLLLKNGVIDPATLASAIERQKGQNPQRLGELLISAGAINPEQLEQYIGIQIEEAVYFLFTWSSGSFHFEADVAPDRGEILVSINPERLLLEGARRVDEWGVIEKKIPSSDLVFASDPAHLADAAGELTAEQSRVLALLDGHQSVREVVDRSGLLSFEATRALFGLIQAGLAHPVGRKESDETDADRAAHVQSHENLGIAFYQTGMLEEAERELLRVLEIDPSRWEARFRLASVEMRRSAFREAARRLMGLIGDGRQTPTVFHNLALCLEAMGRLEHALLTIDEGRRDFPAHPPLLLARGIILTKRQRPAAACRAFAAFARMASRADVLPAAYYVFSTLALAASGRVEEAVSRSEEGLGYYPRHLPLLIHSAVVHEHTGRRAEAVSRFRRALHEDPASSQARRGLADVSYDMGIFEEAGELYRGLLATDSDAELRFRLGNIAYDHGNRLEAIAYWRDALVVDPDHRQARTRLRLIESGLHSVSG